MAGTISTAMCTSFKQELLQAGHCFSATVTPTCGATPSGATTITGLSSMNGVNVGMNVSGPAGLSSTTFIANILSTTSFTFAPPNATSFAASTTLAISGDQFNLALVKGNFSSNYGATTTNYSTLTTNLDETTNGAGTSYSAGGSPLVNVGATFGGTTAYTTFVGPGPSWSTATFSTAGCLIYNTSVRDGTSVAGFGVNRACSVHDFGGIQQVSSGTFSVLLPPANSTQAILRIS